MAFNIADRVKETTSTTGTGTITLSGAVAGYVSFTSAIGDGNTCYYCIQTQTEIEWEVGLGTVTSGTLTRTTVLASSNGGSLVNFSAGTKYVFNTEPAIHLKSLVPYTGATASVNLGTYGITSDYLQLSTTPTATSAVARMLWNDTDGTYDIGLKGGNVTLQVGQEEVVRVVNKTGATLTEAAYQAVYISGAQGQRPKVALAQGNADATSAATIGLVTETIANNAEGFITTSGIVRGINTTGSLQGETWVDGDLIFLSPTTAGAITNIRPTAPNHTVVIGYVIYAHSTQGKIFVKVDNGYELGELHDIYAPSPTNKQSIYWNSSTSRYELATIATTLGYTPANDSLVMQLAGTETATGVKTFSIGLATTTGDNFLNTSSGNLLVGHSSTPPTNTYKLNVNGTTSLGGKLTVQSGTIQKFLYTNTSSGLVSFSIGTGYELYGTSHSANGYNTFLTTSEFANGWNIIIGNNTYKSLEVNHNNVAANVDFRAKAGMSNITGNGSMVTYFSSPYEGFKPNTTNLWGFGIFNSDNSIMMAVKNTGQFVLSNYTTTTSFTGTVAGLLGFDSSGNIITTSASGSGISGSGTAGQVTYWSGTSAVTGSSNLFWDNTNGRLGIGTSSPGYKLDVSGDTLIKGSGTTSSTSALLVTNNSNTNIFRVRNDGQLRIASEIVAENGSLLTLTSFNNLQGISFNAGNFFSRTSGESNFLFMNVLSNPTSGTGVFNTFKLNPSINQTGGANGITRGLYINPTLTSAADFRAIETSVGKIIFGGLPTSSAGLPSGALWNNSGVINIV